LPACCAATGHATHRGDARFAQHPLAQTDQLRLGVRVDAGQAGRARAPDAKLQVGQDRPEKLKLNTGPDYGDLESAHFVNESHAVQTTRHWRFCFRCTLKYWPFKPTWKSVILLENREMVGASRQCNQDGRTESGSPRRSSGARKFSAGSSPPNCHHWRWLTQNSAWRSAGTRTCWTAAGIASANCPFGGSGRRGTSAWPKRDVSGFANAATFAQNHLVKLLAVVHHIGGEFQYLAAVEPGREIG